MTARASLPVSYDSTYGPPVPRDRTRCAPIDWDPFFGPPVLLGEGAGSRRWREQHSSSENVRTGPLDQRRLLDAYGVELAEREQLDETDDRRAGISDRESRSRMRRESQRISPRPTASEQSKQPLPPSTAIKASHDVLHIVDTASVVAATTSTSGPLRNASSFVFGGGSSRRSGLTSDKDGNSDQELDVLVASCTNNNKQQPLLDPLADDMPKLQTPKPVASFHDPLENSDDDLLGPSLDNQRGHNKPKAVEPLDV